MSRRQLHIVAVLMSVLATTLAGCFTGIESTPKITANDVRRQKAGVTPEQQYMRQIAPQPFAHWQPGKRFVVTDDKISLIFNSTAALPDTLAGRELVYRGTQTATRVDGGEATELLFDLDGANRVAYRINSTLDDLQSRGTVEVPFTVDLDLVQAAANLMDGQVYYTVTPLWYDAQLRPIKGRKFVPVTVLDVMAGNQVYPLRLRLTDQGGQEFWLMMSAGDQRSATRNFDALFSLTDPHQRYPQITDEMWAQIIDGRVAQYMTTEESRLAIGSPNSIDRYPSSSGLTEIWQYDDGQYLIFEDGVLQRFRQ